MTEISLTQDQLKDLLELQAQEKKKAELKQDPYGAGAYFRPEPKDSEFTRAYSGIISVPMVNPDNSFLDYKNAEGYSRIARDSEVQQFWADIYVNKDGSLSLRFTSVYDPNKKSTKGEAKPKAPAKPAVDDKDLPF